ncbi:MAG: LpqB family beta-propeller domain-containing protein [Bryobacteraceae bacterium]
MALSFGFAGVSPAAEGRAHFTLNDILSVEPIGETALSPDGSKIAVVRGGQIKVMPAAGGWPVPLTSVPGNKNGLSWAPDGNKIAYASGGSIWTVPVSGGQPHRLTHAAPGAGDPRQAGDRAPQWSPKSEWIAFETGRRGHSSINLVNEAGTVERLLIDSPADEIDPRWSHDGTRIAYVERSPEYFSGKLKVIKVGSDIGKSGDPATLYTAPQDRGGGWALRPAAWSPDDTTLAVVLQETGWDHVYLIPANGGKPKALSAGEFDEEAPSFSPDGKAIAVASNRKLREASSVWVLPMNGSAAHPVAGDLEPGIAAVPEWSPDGKKIYFHRSSPRESADLVAVQADGRGTPAYLTHTLPAYLNGLQSPKTVSYKSQDGTEISAILYQPQNLNAGKRYPAVLWIHGGPEAQDQLRLDLWAQYLAQEGYVVLEPNYRGSTGYGEKFRNANVEDSGGGEVDDVAAGAKYLLDAGLADPTRLAIGGGSHGGTMVAYAVTKYPTLFQAAIEMYGVVDRATFLERTNRNSAVRWAMKMGGSPAEKPDVYLRANSLLKVKSIQTPLLVLHGENDPQVPPYESAQFVKALKQNNKIFYYFTYPNELHGFSQREHRLDAWTKELAFLEKYINPKYGTSNSSVDDLLGAGQANPAAKPLSR